MIQSTPFDFWLRGGLGQAFSSADRADGENGAVDWSQLALPTKDKKTAASPPSSDLTAPPPTPLAPRGQDHSHVNALAASLREEMATIRDRMSDQEQRLASVSNENKRVEAMLGDLRAQFEQALTGVYELLKQVQQSVKAIPVQEIHQNREATQHVHSELTKLIDRFAHNSAQMHFTLYKLRLLEFHFMRDVHHQPVNEADLSEIRNFMEHYAQQARQLSGKVE